MPGPKSTPVGGKSVKNRGKKRHTLRAENGHHKRGSQNFNKNYDTVVRGQ